MGRRYGLVVAERRDQLTLVHLGATLDADLAGLLQQVVLAAVLVVAAPTAPGCHLLLPLGGAGVGDASRLLLARTVPAQRVVGLLVLDAGAGHVAPLPTPGG